MFIFLLLLMFVSPSMATTYTVGPQAELKNIGDVPWETLAPGDSVKIHWRPKPYREKWVICRRGTETEPIVVHGVVNDKGERPVIDGRNATTRAALDYWSEVRGVIKIGGANVPADTMPAHIVVENLEVRSARPPYTFVGREGVTTYAQNSAAIYLEKGEHITIRNCVLHDCGNGFFSAHQSSQVLVERCYIYGNGMEGRIYEHNNYTEANGIVFQFNRFGPLRAGCLGNNLKDRSAGAVIRYNWIEDGNRQLDLVDSGHEALISTPAYRTTFVYGNVLIEGDGEGNSQIVHYGGDSDKMDQYRKGTLYFYNNTVVSTRTDQTTLFRLSTNDETCQMFNNIVFTTEAGALLAMSDEAGKLNMRNNWVKVGWSRGVGVRRGRVAEFKTFAGRDPGFVDVDKQDFRLKPNSQGVDDGIGSLPRTDNHPVLFEYHKHQQGRRRAVQNEIDLGAFESRTTIN